MKAFLLTIFSILFFQWSTMAQTPASKIILKNNDVLTGKIIEMKPGEFVKIEIVGNNVLTIPYAEIAQIILDVSSAPTSTSLAPSPAKLTKPALSDFYFETINEVGLGLGMGEVYGFGFDTLSLSLANSDVYGGFFTVNGVGYKNKFFAGIGIGILGHSGYDDNSTTMGYSMPFTLDLRYRPFDQKKFSPLVSLSTGMSYYEGSIGTFTLLSGLGLSIRFDSRFDAQLLLTHHYDRFSPQLSVENGFLEQMFSGAYVNYGGARLGVSYRL
jgi:hypothetical protein